MSLYVDDLQYGQQQTNDLYLLGLIYDKFSDSQMNLWMENLS